MMARTRTGNRPRASATSRVLAGCAIGLGVLVVLVLGVAAYLVFSGGSRVPAGTPVQVDIVAGSNTREIAETLARAGVIRNANMFRLQVRVSNAGGTLRAGVYDLATGMPDELVIKQLQEGPPIAYTTVAIPEGFTVDQIAARLEKTVGIPSSDFLELAKGGAGEFSDDHPYLKDAYQASLEGYLFPKTYRMREGTTAREAIEMMLDQFDEEFALVDTAPIASRRLSTAQLVTVASMIERETRVPKERPMVASVVYNRIDKNMRLEIDATIEYVLPGNRLRLKNSHLKIDSPYNTYRHKGLPPGPIANPGLASLKAAAAPAKTNYIYYVLTGKNGSHTFATNLKDFLAAKHKSKEVFGK